MEKRNRITAASDKADTPAAIRSAEPAGGNPVAKIVAHRSPKSAGIKPAAASPRSAAKPAAKPVAIQSTKPAGVKPAASPRPVENQTAKIVTPRSTKPVSTRRARKQTATPAEAKAAAILVVRQSAGSAATGRDAKPVAPRPADEPVLTQPANGKSQLVASSFDFRQQSLFEQPDVIIYDTENDVAK